jgi:hypothetical protein
MPFRKKENSKMVKTNRVASGVKSQKTSANRKLRDNKTTTFVTKTKTDKSLFEDKVRKANELLSKASLID